MITEVIASVGGVILPPQRERGILPSKVIKGMKMLYGDSLRIISATILPTQGHQAYLEKTFREEKRYRSC